MKLVVWDFDKSLLYEANTDTWIVKRFNRAICEEEFSKKGQWTGLVNNALRRLHEQGVTVDQIEKEFQKLDFANKALVAKLASRKDVTQIIVSDANSIYISQILKFHGLENMFELIATNPAVGGVGCGFLA